MRTVALFVTICCGWLSLYGQERLYVAPTGTHAAPGTTAAPLRSPAAAIEQARANGGTTEIILAGGTYEIGATLELSSRDRVSLRAAKGQNATLSGGSTTTLTLQRRQGRLAIYELTSADPFRQLYVNGQRATRSRHPNHGEYLTSAGWDFANRRLLIKGNFTRQLAEAPEAELLVFQSWAEAYLRIKDVELQGVGSKFTSLKFADREGDLLFTRPYPFHKPAHRVVLVNALSLVDSPGEWYHDAEAGLLYYYPRPGEDVARLSVTVPRLETLVRIAGTAAVPAEGIELEGLTFAHTNWNYPSREGYLNIQTGLHSYSNNAANELYVYRPPAAVHVSHARGVRLHRNTFRNLGSMAVDLNYGTQKCEVVGNHLHDIAGSGIFVGKFRQNLDTEIHLPYQPEDERDLSRNDLISNNLIERTGLDYYGTVAIGAGYPRGLRIEHNVIREAPYSGISVGYGWTNKPNAMADNRIAYNDISQVMRELNDGAGIYTLSLQPGTIITRNYIHDMPQPEKLGQNLLYRVYFDEQSGGTQKRPLVFDENILEGPAYLRVLFNQPTHILFNRLYANPRQGTAPSFYDQIGLEDGYRDLLRPKVR